MASRDENILRHIKLHCEDIEGFVQRFGKDFATFTNDKAYFNAVSMGILQIGELAGGLSEDYRTKTGKKIAWSSINGMRNIFAHNSGSIDERLLWETITEDIPILLTFCNYELEQMGKDGDDN